MEELIGSYSKLKSQFHVLTIPIELVKKSQNYLWIETMNNDRDLA